MLQKLPDIDARGEENSIYSKDPKDYTPWSPLRRFGSTVRTLGRSKSSREADPQLTSLTLNVVSNGLNDWSLVENVCRSASIDPSNANCVLRSIIRSFMTGNGFQQLAAGRLWAILMKEANKVVLSQSAKPEFLVSLERIIMSSTLEMVAIDRVVAVLATIVHDKRTPVETIYFSRLWDRLPVQKKLCTPLSPDDVLYLPGSLVRSSFGSIVPDHTVATPLPYDEVPPPAPGTSYNHPQSVSGHEEPMSPTSFVSSPKSMSPGTANLWPQPSPPPRITVEASPEMLPPPYSASRFSSEPGPSAQRRASVIDSYPFAKGYASDIGPDINLDTLEAYPFAKGAFGDVRRACLHNGMRVAIKCLRFYTSAPDTGRHRLEKRSLKEIQVWSFLDHENVLPLIGLCVVNNELGMVSEFMPNGNVQEYIQRNPRVDRYRLATHICAGLTYLHEHPKHIIHGDLKAVNVVVNVDGIPKLTDFGLAQMVRAEDSTERSSSSSVGGTARWMAYEQICPIAPDTVCQKPNASSDVYSLGMTLYEIFSGKLPFAELRNDAQVIHAIMQGKLPERTPNAFSDPVWKLLNQCWRRNPHERPTARYVLNALLRINQSTN